MLHIHINEHMNAYFKNVHMKYCLCLGRRMKLIKMPFRNPYEFQTQQLGFFGRGQYGV
uniref:Uncharacterized protein n=1 Tax=Anguilla anguilla TaxID=7936 RepID=A0A0E9TLA9_ANGAN